MAPDQYTALVIVTTVSAAATVTGLFTVVRYVRATPQERRVLRTLWLIRLSWRRTALRVGLSHTEQIKPHDPSAGRRTLVPPVRLHRERWGVRLDARTVGRLGLEEFQTAADHLANAWRVPLVRVEQHAPGRIRIRALLTDPLTQTTTLDHRKSPTRTRAAGLRVSTPTAVPSRSAPRACPAW